MLTRVVLTLAVAVAAAGCPDASSESQNSDARNALRKPRVEPREPDAKPASREFNDPREVLFAGRLAVDVMEVASPQRLSELAQRLQQSIREDPEWWNQHVLQHAKTNPGEPLPYDSRSGWSEAEYDEFLALTKQRVMQKKAETILTVTAKEDGVYELDGGETLPDLTGIEIDLNNDIVRTPFGDAKERSEINATEEAVFGAWNGVQWQLEALDDNGITIVRLSVGILESSGRAVLYYEVKKASLDGKRRLRCVLHYDLPP